MTGKIEEIYSDSDIFVINKPAGIPVETKNIATKDCESEIKKILKERGIENPQISAINRLDQPVNGIVLFALNKNAAAKLSKDLSEGKIEKYYKAEVFGSFEKKEGRLEDLIYKEAKQNKSFIVKENSPNAANAKKAVLEYKEVTEGNLEIKLITGRHHQIRVQLSNAGHPILGDTKYGDAESKEETEKKGIKNLKLQAYKLKFRHPKTGKELEFELKE